MAAPPALGLPPLELSPLIAQCDPDPEPAEHLHKHECEEDAVLEAIAAPAGRHVIRIVSVGRWMGESAAVGGFCRIERGRGGEDEAVEVEGACYENTEGRCETIELVEQWPLEGE